MNNDTRTHVVNLLETTPERRRKIALLHYELEHPVHTTETEMISAMALGHGVDGNNCHTEGHISDKTLYIALNYQSKVDKLNADIKEEIVVQLVELEQEQKRLDYYISLLNERQSKVIKLTFFEGCAQNDVARKLAIVSRTVRRIKEEAIDKLVEMYSFAETLKERRS